MTAGRGLRAGLMTLLACALLVLSGCASKPTDPSAAFFPASPASTTSASGPDATAEFASVAGAQPVKGPVSLPNRQLTPGLAASTDTNAICQAPKHVRKPVPYPVQQAIFAAYHLKGAQTHHYAMDYLIPLDIGGSTDVANLWPASLRGNGFHQKQQLNQHLHTLVCQGRIPLAEAQHGIAANWFTMWLKHSGG